MSFHSELFEEVDVGTRTRLERAAKNAPSIRFGERHRGAVRLLQQAFSELGFAMSSGIDGIFGSQTRSAVCRFQRNERLAVDGVVGRNTLRLLDARLAVAPSFEIKIRFLGGLNETQQQAFRLASQRWAQIVSADVPAVETPDAGLVNDVLIDARAVAVDSVEGDFGQAGPTFVRSTSLIPARGIMEFHMADLRQMESDGSLVNVIIHEMGHVLGIGTLWKLHGLVKGAGTKHPVFTGRQAMAAYSGLLGTPEPQEVPLSNIGDPATREGHWRESVFDHELMAGFLDAGINPISRLTLASLEDIGYHINPGAADSYRLPTVLHFAARRLVQRPICRFVAPEVEVLSESAAAA
jgi:hypothetical protein